MAFFPGALSQQATYSYLSGNINQGSIAYYDAFLNNSNYADFINIQQGVINNSDDNVDISLGKYINYNRFLITNLIQQTDVDENLDPVYSVTGNKSSTTSLNISDGAFQFATNYILSGSSISELSGSTEVLLINASSNTFSKSNEVFSITTDISYTVSGSNDETNYTRSTSLVLDPKNNMSLSFDNSSIVLDQEKIEFSGSSIVFNNFISGSIQTLADGTPYLRSAVSGSDAILITSSSEGYIEFDVDMTVIQELIQSGSIDINSDDVEEGTTNLFFTDERAQTASVVNTLSGSETNQAPSVSSIKTYISASDFATITGEETLTNKTLTDPIVSGSLNLVSTNTTQPVLSLTANSLNDGVGILNLQGSEPDIVFNQTGPGFTTFTFQKEGVDKLAFGKNDSDNFYITRNDDVNGWVNDTFVINRTSGDVYISSQTEVVDGTEAALVVNGGASIAKSVNIGKDLYVSGNLTFSNSGTITLPESSSLPSSTIAVTQLDTDNSTKVATTEFVKNVVDNLSSSLVLDLSADQILFTENGQNTSGSNSFKFKNINSLSSKTLIVGTEPNFPLTVKTAITTNDSYNGTYTALLAQNTSTSSLASTNIYLKNDIASETEGYAVFGLEGSSYNSNSDYLSEKANSLYIGNSHGDITIMPNFYQDPAGGSTHITYDYGLKGISVTNAGAISTETTFDIPTQEYQFTVGNIGDVLTSRGENGSVIWVSKESILSSSNSLISNITGAVGLNSSGSYVVLTGSNYLTGSTSVSSGLIALDNTIKSISDDLQIIDDNRLSSNSYYVNDGINDIQTVIDQIGTDQSNTIYMSPGSYGGSTVLIDNSNDLNIAGPMRATSSHMCELAAGRGLTISGSNTTRITINNLNIEGAVSINGTQGRHYFKNIIFDSTVSITNGTSNFIVFEDCNFAGAITIANTVSAIIYFNRCNFNNQLITSNVSTPTQVILTECAGIKTTQTNLLGLVFVGRTGFYDNTVSNYQTNSKYVYNLLTGATTTFTGDYTELRNLPTLVTSSAQLTDSGSLLRTSNKGVAGGVAPLDNSGKIDISYIPSTVLTDVHGVADEDARLALSDLTEGDIAVQADDGSVWIWDGTQWLSMSVGNGTVTSVNNKTGPSVTLTTDDIEEPVLSPTNLWFTDTRARTASVVNTLSGSETDQAPSVSSIKTYIDNFNSNTNYVLVSDYEDTDVLNKIKNVDGSGSGLDADLLDGLNGNDFVKISTTQTITGDKTFSGSVYLSGSNITVNTQSPNDNSTKIASTAYVDAATAAIVTPPETIQDVAANLFVSSSTSHLGIKYSYNDNSAIINSEVIKSVQLVTGSTGVHSSSAGSFYVYNNTSSSDTKQFLIESTGFGSEVYFQNKSNIADIQIIGALPGPVLESNMQYIYWNGTQTGPWISFTIAAGDHNIYRFVHAGTVTSSPDGIMTWYHTLWHASIERTSPFISDSNIATLSETQTFTGNKTFTGSVFLSGSNITATTQTSSDNSTKVATTAFVQSAITAAATPAEQIEDVVAAMILSGSHTGVVWNYIDASGSLNLSVNLASTGLTDSAALVRTSSLGQINGVATLDAGGKIPSSQLPAISLAEVFVVQTIELRDALTVQEGDIAVVTDTSQTFIYDGSSWIEISASGSVTSVNTQTGNVVLTTDNIDEGNSRLYFTDARAKTATVLNTLSGSQTDQAPSVQSVKTYLSSSISNINSRLDQVDTTLGQIDTRLIKLEYRDGGVWDQDVNSIYFDPDNYIIRQTYGAWSFKPSSPNDLIFTSPQGGPGDRHWSYTGDGSIIFTGVV